MVWIVTQWQFPRDFVVVWYLCSFKKMSAKCFLKKANSLWWRFFLLVKLYSKNNQQWLEWSEQSLSLLQYSASLLVDKVAEWKDRSRKGQKYATRAPPDDDYVRDYVRRGVHGLWLLRLLTNCTYIGSRRRRSSSDGAKAAKRPLYTRGHP